MRLQRSSTGCGASCVAAFALAAVQGFSTTAAAEWGDDDVVEGDTRSAGKKIIDAIKVGVRGNRVGLVDYRRRWYDFKKMVFNARPIHILHKQDVADKAAAALDEAGEAFKVGSIRLIYRAG